MTDKVNEVSEASVSVERQIEMFILNNFNYTNEQVSEMTIQKRMSLINMRDEKKWGEFKLGLRKAGYII